MIARLLILCLAAAAAVAAQTAPPGEPLTLVSTAWSPFTNESGRPRFALDLVEAALARTGLASKTTIVPAGDFTAILLGGRFDGSAAAWKDAERERALIFSQPYLENRLVLVGRVNADVSARTLGDLKGKRVALVQGYAYGEAVDQAGPVFVRAASEEDSLARLLKAQVEYALMDDLVVQYIVSNYPQESRARLRIGSTPLVKRPLHFAIRRTRADAEAIVSKFNAQLRAMIQDRTYHRLLHVDWIEADITGDGVAELVPASDRVGPLPPQHAYTLFAEAERPTAAPPKTGFYVGGTIYQDWASVPASYKEINPRYPDPRRSSASVFTFTW